MAAATAAVAVATAAVAAAEPSMGPDRGLGTEPGLGALDALLGVQERDVALDRLAHRRATLPERASLSGAEAELAVLDERRAEVGARGEELGRRQQGREADVAATEQRIRDIERRLYGGEVSASRELAAMAEEVDHLRQRQSTLEDEALALMVEAEPVDAELARLDAERERLEGRRVEAAAALARAEEVIDAEAGGERSARDRLAAGIPAALLEQYERLRGRLDGVGAARLVNGSCTGCHLALPASERDRIRHLPPDAVVTCDQCGRILVR